MSNIVLYNKNNIELKPVAFIKQTFNLMRLDQVKGQDVNVAITKCLFENAMHLNIKDLTPGIVSDITEMILMRFKELSLDEIYYAFKLYRYGLICDDLQSYGQMNTVFCQKLLSGYKEWKSKEIKKNNISKRITRTELTEEEKEIQMALGVARAYDDYLKSGVVGFEWHVYDFLNDKGLIDVCRDDKLKALDMAKKILIGRANERKQRGKLTNLKAELERINTKMDNDVIQKAKSITLEYQFRKWKANGKKAEEILK